MLKLKLINVANVGGITKMTNNNYNLNQEEILILKTGLGIVVQLMLESEVYHIYMYLPYTIFYNTYINIWVKV